MAFRFRDTLNSKTLDNVNANVNAIDSFKIFAKKPKSNQRSLTNKTNKFVPYTVPYTRIQDDKNIVDIKNTDILKEIDDEKYLRNTNKRLSRRSKNTEEIYLANTDLYRENNRADLTLELSASVKESFKNLENVIEKHALKPVIVNEECSFVVITYWWGGNNINWNTQEPCEIFYKERRAENKILRAEGKPTKPIIPIKKKAVSYKKMIEQWIDNMLDCDCNYLVEEYPEFTQRGGYQLAINAKPMFIKKALEACGGRSVVYIDGDMLFRSYPYIFDMKNVDYMARGWNIDPRSNDRYLENDVCYDNFVFETSGGIMFFGYTKGAFDILNKFIKISKKPINHNKADDRIISLLFNAQAMFARYNIIQLPIEYLWLTDAYEEYVEDYGDIICEHPACLTEEDIAKEQSMATTNRHPTFYDKFVDNNIDCDSHGGIFYEYMFFLDVGADIMNTEKAEMNIDKAADSYAGYLKYMRNIKTQYISDYDARIPPFYVVDKYVTKRVAKARFYNSNPNSNDMVEINLRQIYGKKQASIAKKNLRAAEKLNSQINSNIAPEYLNSIPKHSIIKPNVVYTKQSKLNNCTIIQNHNDDNKIPEILHLLKQGRDVLYIPKFLNKKIDTDIMESIIKNRPNDIELIAFTNNNYEWNNMDQYQPKMEIDTPVFFSHNSNILYYLIAMCDSIETDFNSQFNSSFIFVTRIRCHWLNLDLEDNIFNKSNSRSNSKTKTTYKYRTKNTSRPNTRNIGISTNSTHTRNIGTSTNAPRTAATRFKSFRNSLF